MANLTFSDGQSVDATLITRATLFEQGEPRLLVELKNDSVIRVFGPGVQADADMLDTIRDERRLNFLVFRVPVKNSN